MNKKQIAALIEEMTQAIVERDGLNEDTARTLVGLAIQQNREALTTVSVPTLVAAPKEERVAA